MSEQPARFSEAWFREQAAPGRAAVLPEPSADESTDSEPTSEPRLLGAGPENAVLLQWSTTAAALQKLDAAESDAAAVRAAAYRDADEIRAAAHREAEALRAAAAAEAARTRAQGGQRAVAVLSEAQAEARELLAATAEHTEQVQAQAQAVLQDLLTGTRALADRLEAVLAVGLTPPPHAGSAGQEKGGGRPRALADRRATGSGY